MVGKTHLDERDWSNEDWNGGKGYSAKKGGKGKDGGAQTKGENSGQHSGWLLDLVKGDGPRLQRETRGKKGPRDRGGSDEWSRDRAGSGDWSRDRAGSGDWPHDIAGSGDWPRDRAGSDDWPRDRAGSDDWPRDRAGSHNLIESVWENRGEICLDLKGWHLDDASLMAGLSPALRAAIRRCKVAKTTPQSCCMNVDASENSLTADGMAALVDFLLSLNKLSSSGAAQIHVRTLRVYKNSLGDAGAWQVARLILLQPAPVHELHLSHNQIGSLGAAQILLAVGANPMGVYPFKIPPKNLLFNGCWVRLEQNNISDAGSLLEALQSQKTVSLRSSSHNHNGPFGPGRAPAWATSPKDVPHAVVHSFHHQVAATKGSGKGSADIEAVVEKAARRVQELRNSATACETADETRHAKAEKNGHGSIASTGSGTKTQSQSKESEARKAAPRQAKSHADETPESEAPAPDHGEASEDGIEQPRKDNGGISVANAPELEAEAAKPSQAEVAQKPTKRNQEQVAQKPGARKTRASQQVARTVEDGRLTVEQLWKQSLNRDQGVNREQWGPWSGDNPQWASTSSRRHDSDASQRFALDERERALQGVESLAKWIHCSNDKNLLRRWREHVEASSDPTTEAEKIMVMLQVLVNQNYIESSSYWPHAYDQTQLAYAEESDDPKADLAPRMTDSYTHFRSATGTADYKPLGLSGATSASASPPMPAKSASNTGIPLWPKEFRNFEQGATSKRSNQSTREPDVGIESLLSVVAAGAEESGGTYVSQSGMVELNGNGTDSPLLGDLLALNGSMRPSSPAAQTQGPAEPPGSPAVDMLSLLNKHLHDTAEVSSIESPTFFESDVPSWNRGEETGSADVAGLLASMKPSAMSPLNGTPSPGSDGRSSVAANLLKIMKASSDEHEFITTGAH
eukprot:TRINITY_DN2649_c0_g1_i2.p1 TRINITY_DN2649_c0_g1~~TRINITY_DN2649_c0_g1_i2.p1  ORF type:complete len:914 (-),score=148.18 TRINITY_DN2649_c0_g1_i2:109-2850(-)